MCTQVFINCTVLKNHSLSLLSLRIGVYPENYTMLLVHGPRIDAGKYPYLSFLQSFDVVKSKFITNSN